MAAIEQGCPNRQDEQEQAGAAGFRPKGTSGPQLRTGDLQLENRGKGKPAHRKAKKTLKKVPTEMEGER